MMLLSFTRALRLAVTNMWRNLWLSVATVFVIALALFSMALLAAINLVASRAITAVEEKVDIAVFFVPDVLDQDVAVVQNALEAKPEVGEVTLISREQALAEFRERNSGNETVEETLDILGENPLGPSLLVTAQSISDFPTIVGYLDNPEWTEYIQETDYRDNQLLVERLDRITGRAEGVMLTVSLVFILIALLIVFNTIRINIYTQREEINIMRLVGATGNFIRLPFLLESVIYALVGSVLTLVVITPLIAVIAPQADAFFEGYNFDLQSYFGGHFLQIAALLLIVSLVLSTLSSAAALARYLKK